MTRLFNYTMSVIAPDEASAWRRLRQVMVLEAEDQLARRVVVEELLGATDPEERLSEYLTEEQIRARLGMVAS